ncbi:MAG: (2Fe-2S)-binding protein [Rhodospirillaceae bacterium]|nr:(2Fe-2S)-binding protein [Rhodospirillaceae bacterium]
MFRRTSDAIRPAGISIHFEGRPIVAQAGDSLAAALLIEDVGAFRSTPVSGAPRAPYCMMGVCFECLVEVDGVPNQQACMVQVRDGMQVRRQRGPAGMDGNG